MKNPTEDKNINPKMLAFMQSESLTHSLKQLDAEFSVKLIYLGESSLVSDKKMQLLSANSNHRFLTREVNLLLNGIPVVRGKSTCKLENDFWRDYLDINNQSLGEKLFSSSEGIKLKTNSINRTEFLWFYKEPSLNSMINNPEKIKHWSRMSIFEHSGQELLLEEVFLLDLKKFIK